MSALPVLCRSFPADRISVSFAFAFPLVSRRNKQMTFNPTLATKVLKYLYELPESENGTATICASDFGIDYLLFGVQLDGMWREELILPVIARFVVFTFEDAIKDNETRVRVSITDKGAKRYIEGGQINHH
jgi:hypothetical protein